MPSNKELYFDALVKAFIIELVVMAIWIYPLMTAGMTHSAIAAAQTPWIVQILGFLGFVFHFPSIVLAFWFPPLVPFVQMFLLSGIIFCKYKFVDNQIENIPQEKYKYIK